MLEPIFGPTIHSILEELEANYPPFIPHPTEPTNAIMYKAGQRSVIEWIKLRLNEDQQIE